MITCQCAEAMRTYATQSSYLTPIPNVNIDRGVIPLDSLPADWWNWLWQNITLNEGYIVQFINSVFSEINSVLSAAGVSPSTASTTDLRDAIQNLAQVVATSSVPGSVLSSTLSGKLNVIADGTATINGLGTPSDLQTTADNVVAAINEVLTLASGKAPTSHASSNNTYGVGTTQQFGHVKVTEGCGLSICDGTISLDAPGYNCLGNVTTICFNGNTYTPTDGVIDLGTQTISVDCVCQRAITSSTSGDFYPILGGGLCRNTSGVGEVNLVGLSWNPVCHSLEWNDNYVNIGTCAYGGGTGGISIGSSAGNTATCGIAIGHSSYNSGAEGIAIGREAYNVNARGIAIGCCLCIGCCSAGSVAIGAGTCIYCCSANSVAIGQTHLYCKTGNSVAIGYGACICPNASSSVAIGPLSFVQACSANSVAIGPGAFAGCIRCCGRNFYLQTIGDAYQLRIDVCSTSDPFLWCDLACTFQKLFRNCYTGRYKSCPNYIYLGKSEGASFCSVGIGGSSYPYTYYDGFTFLGALARPEYYNCTWWVNLYWGNNWRRLSGTDTGSAGWLDTAGRTIMINGLIGGI